MKVKTGLQRFLTEESRRFAGQRIGLICNPSSVDADLRHAVDLFHQHAGLELTTLMGPQHGIRGETQDNMIEWEGFRDSETGLPVHSLYGQHRKPTPGMLADVDVVVFDLQDVGSRYYTFIYTMALTMEACREQNKPCVILDRPNPIDGLTLEGPILNPEYRSFVGFYPMPVRHGLTVGELAGLFNQEFGIGCDLEVVPMHGWRRDMTFEESGLPWVLPSPNMPTVDTAFVYPGFCLFEGTNVSEGRGTTRPFEITGAPWISGERAARELNARGLPGVRFRAVHFIPTFHKWEGSLIGGVQTHVTDRRVFQPFRTALEVLKLYRDTGGSDFGWKSPPYEYEYEKLPFDILCGGPQIREGLEAGLSIAELEGAWQGDLASFYEIRSRYLLY